MGILDGSVRVPRRVCAEEAAKGAARAQACDSVHKILDPLVTVEMVASPCLGDCTQQGHSFHGIMPQCKTQLPRDGGAVLPPTPGRLRS